MHSPSGHSPSENSNPQKIDLGSQGASPGQNRIERDPFAELLAPSLSSKFITNQKLSTDFEKRVAILGAGSYGAAIAAVLANNGIDAAIWARREDSARSINERNESEKAPGLKLPKEIWASSDMERVMRDRGIIILASPSSSLQEVANTFKPHPDSIVINLAKGFVFEGGNPFKTAADYQRGPERGTRVTLPTMFLERIPHWEGFDRVATVSGPGFAKNILAGKQFGLTVAAHDIELARTVRKLFVSRQVSPVYVTDDVCTVQLAGAMKNVFAICAGVDQGLAPGGKFGIEGMAILIPRGLSEIESLARKCAEAYNCRVRAMSSRGIASLGDLVLTSLSSDSRNYQMGRELGRGTPVVEAINKLSVTAEGLGNAWGAKMLADQLATNADGKKLFVPISNAVVDLLQGYVSPERVFDVLFQELELLAQGDYIGDPDLEGSDIYI